MDGRTDPSLDPAAALELAVVAGLEAVERVARAGLLSASGPKVYQARSTLAAIRGVLRALEAVMQSGSTDRLEELVDRLDRLDSSFDTSKEP